MNSNPTNPEASNITTMIQDDVRRLFAKPQSEWNPVERVYLTNALPYMLDIALGVVTEAGNQDSIRYVANQALQLYERSSRNAPDEASEYSDIYSRATSHLQQ